MHRAGGGHSRSRARSTPSDPDDDVVHTVRLAATGVGYWRGKRAAAAARFGRHRWPGTLHTHHVICGADTTGRDPRGGLPATVTAPGMVWSHQAMSIPFSLEPGICAY